MNSQNVASLLITQCWQVAVLALVIWGASRWILANRPRMTHMLWGLVLIKALTPPIVSIPIGAFCQAQAWMVETPSGPYTPASNPAARRAEARSPSRMEWQLASDIAAPVASTMVRDSRKSTWLSWSRVRDSFLCLWLVGCLASLTWAAIRWMSFAKRVRRGIQLPPSTSAVDEWDDTLRSLTQVADNLRAQLRVPKLVKVCMVDEAIGPAVMGLFRPTVLLPFWLMREKSTSEQELLIAHEFIHIRRGDLWWAFVQTLGTTLFWFHPLVRIASKNLTLESERSCDEETILALRCSPAAYARCLVDVLERKSELHIAPAVPGVRPVDVTRDRLERIMLCGHGSPSSPRWATWCLFMVIAVLVLPGRAWLTAQEISTRNNQAATTKGNELKSAPLSIEPVRVELDVADLLDALMQSGATVQNAEQELLARLDLRSSVKQSDPGAIVSEKQNSPQPFFADRKLILSGTAEEIDRIESAIAALRIAILDHLSIQAYVITVPRIAIQESGMQWTRIDDPSSNPLTHDKAHFFAVPESMTLRTVPVQMCQLDEAKKRELLDKFSNDPKCNTLCAPRLLMQDGQTGEIQIGRTQAQLDPPTSRQNAGNELHMKIRASKQDNGQVNLSFGLAICLDEQSRWKMSEGNKLDFTMPLAKEDDDSRTKPTMVIQRLQTQVTSGHSVMFTPAVEPISADSPVLVCCVTTQIVQPERTERLPATPINLAATSNKVSRSRIHSGQIDDPIIILQRVAKIDQAEKMPPPTEDEIMSALFFHWRQSANIPKPTRVELKKIQAKTDPQRFVPLIGYASVEHEIFEVTLWFPSTGDAASNTTSDPISTNSPLSDSTQGNSRPGQTENGVRSMTVHIDQQRFLVPN